MKTKRGYKRGYPVALLVGFEQAHAALWQVFSHVVKPHQTLNLAGRRTDERALYDFHESVLNALRPVLKEGVRSVVVTAPTKTNYTVDFMDHVRKHHAYLLQSKGPNKVTFAELVGSADQPHSVAELVKTKEFRELIVATTSGEADQIVSTIERSLNSNQLVLFSLKEIEDAVYNQEKDDFSAAYLVLTDKYLAESGYKHRIHRLQQISANKKAKTRIIDAETPAGKRITQFGGLIFFISSTK